jgi:hypothetical protein
MAGARVGASHRCGVGGAAQVARRQCLPVGKHLCAGYMQCVVVAVDLDRAALGQRDAVAPRGVLSARRRCGGWCVGPIADLAGGAPAAEVAGHIPRGVLKLVRLRRCGCRCGRCGVRRSAGVCRCRKSDQGDGRDHRRRLNRGQLHGNARILLGDLTFRRRGLNAPIRTDETGRFYWFDRTPPPAPEKHCWSGHSAPTLRVKLFSGPRSSGQ